MDEFERSEGLFVSTQSFTQIPQRWTSVCSGTVRVILIKPSEILGARFKVLFCESPFSQMVGTGLQEGRTAMVGAVIFI